MLKLLRKSAFVGLGLAVMSKDAVMRMGERLAEESKLSEEEGKKLVDDLLAESEKSKESLKKRVDKTLKQSISEMDLATSNDLKAINRRLDRIEEKLDPKADVSKPAGFDINAG